MKRSVLIACCLLGLMSATYAADGPQPSILYVAPGGNDAWSGRCASPNVAKTDGPLATLPAARDAIRRLRQSGRLPAPVTVMLRSGVYHLSQPLVLEPEDSGTADRPIVYCAYPNETPEITGGVEIRGWQPVPESSLWVTADVPKPLRDPLQLRQLFVNGQRRPMARRPHTGQFRMLGRAARRRTRRPARKWTTRGRPFVLPPAI